MKRQSGHLSRAFTPCFTRFYRINKSRARASGGSELGFTISKNLVEAHGGRIWVESDEPETGSRFFFTLPYWPYHRSPDAALGFEGAVRAWRN